MANEWKLHLGVVASGHDDTRVSLRPMGRGRSPYVVVRTGAVIAHCLGPAAVGSAAQAWAAARARLEAMDLGFRGYAEPGPIGRPGGEAAVPCGSVVFDGQQRWAIHVTRGTGVLVTVGCLQVLARDRVAFDLHVRTWTQAVELAAQAYPSRHVPFSRMLANARYNELEQGVGLWQPPHDVDPDRGLEL
jgi:hypothetical protein